MSDNIVEEGAAPEAAPEAEAVAVMAQPATPEWQDDPLTPEQIKAQAEVDAEAAHGAAYVAEHGEQPPLTDEQWAAVKANLPAVEEEALPEEAQ
jgi:hypothetical protein